LTALRPSLQGAALGGSRSAQPEDPLPWFPDAHLQSPFGCDRHRLGIEAIRPGSTPASGFGRISSEITLVSSRITANRPG
jgi:hypothetical protein